MENVNSVGGQRKRFNDNLKGSLKDFSIDTEHWESLAENREVWRGLVSRGAQSTEEPRTQTAIKKRVVRKARTPATH